MKKRLFLSPMASANLYRLRINSLISFTIYAKKPLPEKQRNKNNIKK